MKRIAVVRKVICGMAGPVTYFTKPCPYAERSVFGGVATVGSTACQMCPNFVGQLGSDEIECKHE